MPVPTASPRALLPSEALLLSGRGLAGALDGGLVAEAEASGVPAAIARVAVVEQFVGRGHAGLARIHGLAATSDDPDVLRIARAMERLDEAWGARRGPAELPDPAADHEPGGVLRLAAETLAVSIADAEASGLEWGEVRSQIDRMRDAAERWLRAATTAPLLVDGMPGAVYAAVAASVSEQSPWAIDFLTALRRRMRRHALAAWSPVLDCVTAIACSYLGRFEESERYLERSIPALAAEPTQPWYLLALASRGALVGVTRAAPPPSFTRLVDELLAGRWDDAYPYARHVAHEILGRVRVFTGDAAGGLALMSAAAPIRELGVPHVLRVVAAESAFTASLDAGDVEAALDWLDWTATLFGSASRAAAEARMRHLLGEDVDLFASAGETGLRLEEVRSRLTLIRTAIRGGRRDEALRQLAALEAAASTQRAFALAAESVRLFHAREGEATLSDRVLQVAALAAGGMTNAQIARELVVSVRTVESHVSTALAILGLRRRAELAGALRTATPGIRPALTPRQGQVAALIAAGCTNAEAARALGVTESAIEKQVTGLVTMLGVAGRAGIAAAYLRARH